MRWIEVAGTLAIAATAAGVQQSPPPVQRLPQGPAVPAVPSPLNQPGVQPPRFLVVIDAAHGGTDIGARIGEGIEEKEIALGLAGRLRSTLHARGVDVVMTRTADANPGPANRAEAANHAQASACLTIHATATGSGVHLYTSSLTPAANERFLLWGTAQAAYVTQSMKLESEIDTALAHAAIPVTLGKASVAPMDSMACPEVAVELAPLVGGHVTSPKPLTDVSYQKTIVDAVAAALEQWRSDWKP
jgi:N-acetylmuramoyl-L-alanine amidase